MFMNAYSRSDLIVARQCHDAGRMCSSVAAPISAQEGVKETERFIKAGGNLSHAVAEAKLQVQTTLVD
jgi:hypothetical protein